MKVTYRGRQPAVVLLATGQTVARDETVEVPADIGRQLVAQGWSQPAPKPKPTSKPKPKKAKAKKKAAAPNPKSEED